MFRIFILFFIIMCFLYFVYLFFIYSSFSLCFLLKIDLFFFDFPFIFNIDYISLIFVLLSLLLTIYLFLIYWNVNYLINYYMLVISLLGFFLIFVFTIYDLFLFFFFFELSILPLYLLVILWGSRERKVYAANLLLFYTLIGSLFILFVFIFLFFITGSSNFFYLTNIYYNKVYYIYFFIFIFLGFSVKIPLVPFHIWLPEAHVEAPTPGSILLAGIILKLAFYGFFRILLFFEMGLYYWWGLIVILLVFSFYFSSFLAFTQYDFKKILAYSSISHMNFAFISFFCFSNYSFISSFFLMLGHAFVSSSLFFIVGLIYERYKTRSLFYYSGLSMLMPILSFFFFIFILGNFGFPGTINFVGEFLIFLSIFYNSYFLTILVFGGLFLTLLYSLYLYVRLVNGIIVLDFIKYYSVITRREFFLLLNFLFFILFFGLFPNFILDYIYFFLIYTFI